MLLCWYWNSSLEPVILLALQALIFRCYSSGNTNAALALMCEKLLFEQLLRKLHCGVWEVKACCTRAHVKQAISALSPMGSVCNVLYTFSRSRNKFDPDPLTNRWACFSWRGKSNGCQTWHGSAKLNAVLRQWLGNTPPCYPLLKGHSCSFFVGFVGSAMVDEAWNGQVLP